MPADSELASQFKYSQACEVSIGPFSREWADFCPDCDCGDSRGLFSRACPNLHPYYASMYIMFARDQDEVDAVKKRIPLYARRVSDKWVASEVSVVFQPALPTARVPRNK